MSRSVVLRISRTESALDIPLPRPHSPGAAGSDLHAAVVQPVVLAPGQFASVPTGLRVAIPPGYEIQVRPRSGLAARHGIGILNAPGTIDSDYRGEIHVILFNFGSQPHTIQRGDRIAQIILARVEAIQWEETPDLDDTQRGAGGFGHTGR